MHAGRDARVALRRLVRRFQKDPPETTPSPGVEPKPGLSYLPLHLSA